MKQDKKREVWKAMEEMRASNIDLEVFYISIKTNQKYKKVYNYIGKFKKPKAGRKQGVSP